MPPPAKRRKTTGDQQSFDELMQSIKGMQLKFKRSQRDIDAKNAQRALIDASWRGETASGSVGESDEEAKAAVAMLAKQLRKDAMSGGRTRKRSKARRTRRRRQRRRATTRKGCGCSAKH